MNAAVKLAKYLKPYWLWAVLAPLLMMIEVAMDLMQPRMIQRIVDEGIAQYNMDIIIQTALIMIGLALFGAVGGIGCTIFSVLASQGFGTDLRGELFRKVQSLSFGNLDELETGGIITRLTNDVVQVQEMVAMLLRIMVRAPLMMVGSLVLAILTSPQLALLFIALLPLVGILLTWVVRKAYPMFSQVQQRLDDLNTVIQENLAGVRVVKAFVRADREIERFSTANNNLMDQTIRAARAVAITWPGIMLVVNFGIAGAIWFGGVQISVGNLQTGELIAFVNYLTRALMSLMFVSMLMMRLARAQASAVRIEEVMESTPWVINQPNVKTITIPRGEIAFENVTFSYGRDGCDPVLKDINFTAEPGQTVAILGATGSGKSSLINLIPRFYDVSDGRITVDGVDVRDLDLSSLRHQISISMQEAILFSGTIKENIRFGRPDASDEQVIAAAQAAQAHDFIMGFPDGYETILGQRGINLSGGQKQRIAIARALITQPVVLILDDSTSAVDVETESLIETALDNLTANSTRFVIAQRISTVLNAEKILVLDDGVIVGQGRHHELMGSSPIYREIFDSQLGNGMIANGKA
ncbi:MAG: ABC transporter ATP-binding protein [Anaerolineales bacterium]